MPLPKHDYNGDKFYDDVFAFAIQGMNDAEIADALDLTPEVFCRMKNGKYSKWTEEENAAHSERLGQVLLRARRKTTSLVRGAYLKAALGGKKIKTKVYAYVRTRCDCGNDPECEYCHGTGFIVSTSKAVVQESESELAPNMQALSTWLYHHDPEWRKVERKLDEEASDIPTEIKKGVDIASWIDKMVEGETDKERE